MDLATLRSNTRFLVFGNSSDTSYGNTDLDRNLNKAYLKYLALAMNYSGSWQVKGTYAYIDLLAGVCKYDLSSAILRFNRVEAKLTATGEYEKVTPVDVSNLQESIETYEPVNPEYDLRDGFITIYTDKEIEEVENGLKLWVQGNFTALVGTSDEPDLAEPFVDLMNLEAALEYCLANEITTKGREMERRIEKRLPDFKSFYANRSGETPVLRPKEQALY